ncbi:MAG: hypothetical protein ACI9UA_000187 [Pseudoalteromonas tetraodonis]|jgi:hypothetical protein
MEKLKKNYDRVLLIVTGLITLVVGSMLIVKSFAVGQKFQDVEIGDGKKFEESPTEKVTEASTHVDTPSEWKPVVATDSEKKYRLFASIPIVWKNGAPQPIDLFDESTRVREGISNKYLMDHRLPFERNDVAEMDPDGDRFSNQQEFEGGTDPNNKDDYPDATGKLVLTKITALPYLVMFSNAGGNAFSIKRIDPPGARLPREEKWSSWAEMGLTFPESGPEANRFKLLEAGQKDVANPATGRVKKDVPFVMVDDSTSGKTIELIQREKVDIPVYKASFAYDGPGAGMTPKKDEYDKGDVFKLDGAGTDLKILKITADSAELESTAEGKNPKTIKKSLGNAE